MNPFALIPAPYRLLAMAGLLLLAIGGSYLKGRSDGRAVVNAQAVRAMKKATDELNRRRAVIDSLNTRIAAAQTAQSTETREIFHESVKIIDRPVFRAVCGDADAARLFDRARANANTGIAGQPAFTPAGASSDAP
jgi:hypothetical protein